MKIAVIYSSKTGNTKKVAEVIAMAFPDSTDLIDVENYKDCYNYDFIFMGYWIDKGTANMEAQKVMRQIKNKEVAIFATLGAYPDTEHAKQSLVGGASCFGENTKVVASFICHGAIDPMVIERMRKMPKGGPHAPTAENEKRWATAAKHPDEEDLENAGKFAIETIKTLEMFAPYKQKMQGIMRQKITKEADKMPTNLAQEYGISELAVYQNLPGEMVSFTDVSNFTTIWNEMVTWEKVLFLTINSGIVAEVSGKLSKGKEGHGYFNLMDRYAPLHGHVNVKNLKAIAFVSKPFMGKESHSIAFFTKDENLAFSIYLGRNEKREIIPQAKESFLRLKESLDS